MTALKKYQRLECPGLWRAHPEAQRRDVAVSFGEASLVLADLRNEVPLAHWSLPAVRRRNPGESPAVYSPDADAGETLEIDDSDMIEALETVQRSLRRGQRPLSRRLRLAATGAIVAVFVAFAALWLPEALVQHATSLVPQAKRMEIARMIQADLALAGYPSCNQPLGLRALTRLRERVLGQGASRLAVLSGAEMKHAIALPGGLYLIGRAAIEELDGPEVVAGHILAAQVAAQGAEPLADVLRHAGIRAAFLLLTTGEFAQDAIRGYGAQLLDRPAPAPEPEPLLAQFAAVGVPSSPFAYALDGSGETSLPLIESDPFRTEAPPRPLLTDGEWVSLQGICAG